MEFIPSCPTTTAGLIYLAFDYDPADVDEDITAQTITSMYGTVSGNVFNRHTMTVNTNRLRNYYNTGPIKAGSSINDYQAGNIIIYTSNTVD